MEPSVEKNSKSQWERIVELGSIRICYHATRQNETKGECIIVPQTVLDRDLLKHPMAVWVLFHLKFYDTEFIFQN